MGCCCSKSSEKDAKEIQQQRSQKPPPESPDREQPSIKQRKKVKKDTKYVALWDYKPVSKAELPLAKGDVLEEEIEERDAGPEWVFVSVVKGAKRGTGYAPRAWLAAIGTLEAESWYFGDINRRDAEKILTGMPDGMFCVRSRVLRDTVTLAVSISHDNGVKHYRVKVTTHETTDAAGGRKKKTYYFLGKKKFESIPDMIAYFMKSCDGICCVLTSAPPKPEPERVELSAEVQKNWQEIPRTQIKIEKEIGKGNFGFVRKGVWKPTETLELMVAVKELKPGAAGARKQFLQEAVAMKNLVHERLVKLHGIVSEEPFWIVTEFIKDGALKSYLRKRDKEQRWLPEEKLVNIATQISDGMRYLESKEVVHRDLAARNVLVDEKTGETDRDTTVNVKVADFGMAKMTQKGRAIREKGAMELAVKWTAPEALVDLRFYTASDVWSFGILLHEIFTHGSDPYKGMSPKQVKDYVTIERRILDRAEGVPEKVYEMITVCCGYEYRSRPTFQDIFDILEKFYEKGADPYERYRQ